MFRKTFPLVRQLSNKVSSRDLKPTSAVRNVWDLVRPPSDISRLMREMDRRMESFEREFFKIPPFRYIAPRFIPVDGAAVSGNRFRVDIDVSGFQPEDIKLSIANGKIRMEAKMEKDGEDGKISQHLVREFSVPENLDEKSIESYLHSSGVLTIEGTAKSDEVKKIEIKKETTDAEKIEAKSKL